jgi:hypothetical protein
MCVEMHDLIYRSLIEVVQAGRNRVSESLVVCVGMYRTCTLSRKYNQRSISLEDFRIALVLLLQNNGTYSRIRVLYCN